MKLNIAELDCIFISYDEPNAENHWVDLVDKCIWAKRVHGIKGSDACHKHAAAASDTDWFITVDADNIVDAKFFDQIIDVPTGAMALSWPGVNSINGLRYGNGSLKLWNKSFVLNMRSHEAAGRDSVDFCWEEGYRSMVESYSVTYPHGSPFQAWRAGFREGVKMSLVDGYLPKDPHADKLFWHNLHRLKIWMSVGAHVDNGLWAILGARHACWKTNCTNWDHIDVRDFDLLASIWTEVSMTSPLDDIHKYGDLIEKDFGIKSTLLDPYTSEFVVRTFADQYKQAVEQAVWTLGKNNV